MNLSAWMRSNCKFAQSWINPETNLDLPPGPGAGALPTRGGPPGPRRKRQRRRPSPPYREDVKRPPAAPTAPLGSIPER